MEFCGTKNINSLMIDNIVNECLLLRNIFSNNKKYKICKIDKLMQIRTHARTHNIHANYLLKTLKLA